jgi:DNA polymerase I-like protein with 3'-5' exonuclease and polymerase domains
MLAHAVLWCELPHTLEFCASVYGEYGKFKHLRDSDQLLYNYGDVVDTFSVWQGMVRGFAADPLAEKVYREQSLALVPILLEAGKQGVRVNSQRVVEVFQEYSQVIRKVRDYAELAVGYPINLNSGQQLKHYLYTERELPVQIDKESKRPTTNDDAIARLRSCVGPIFDPNAELTFDLDDERHYSVIKRVCEGADPILECRALWAGTWQVVNNYIIGLCKGVYGESENKRKKARAKYWKEGLAISNIVERIYPKFAIHAQKTGRWSTTDPPLAQLPPDLRDIICSDPDEVCISWDWSAIEPRVLQALTRSDLLKKTFDAKFDLHTWTVCYMFGYEFPPDLVDPHSAPSCEEWRRKYNWKGKDDPRRVFAKQGRYEMWYGGSGSNAAQAAAQFGLNATDLRVALSKLATSDPAYYSWKVKTEAEVKRTAMIRTFMGRPRRFLSSGDSRRREGLDQPMQGAVSDIFNTTVVTLKSQFPFLRWGWGMHDSQKWYVKRAALTATLFEAIRRTVERAYDIAGQVTVFPADFEIILPPEQGNEKLKPKQYFDLAA